MVRVTYCTFGETQVALDITYLKEQEKKQKCQDFYHISKGEAGNLAMK